MKFKRSPMLRDYSEDQLAQLALKGEVILDEGVWYPTVSGGVPISRVTTQDASSDATGASTSATYPAQPTVGNLLIGVAGTLNTTKPSSGINNGTVNMTIISSWTNANGSIWVGIYYKYALASEATTWTAAGGLGHTTLQLYEYANTITSNPLGAFNNESSTVATTGPTAGAGVTTTGNSSLIISAILWGSTQTGITVDSSFNLLQSSPVGGIRMSAADRILAGNNATLFTPNFDWTTSRSWAHFTAEFKAPLGGQTVSITPATSAGVAQPLHVEKRVTISVP